jgi:hypothetical protein
VSTNDDDDLFPEDWQARPNPFDGMSAEQYANLAAGWSKPKRKRDPNAAPRQKPEKAVQNHIERHLKTLGALYRRVNAGSWRDDDGNHIAGVKAGTSDYLALRSAFLLLSRLKRRTAK